MIIDEGHIFTEEEIKDIVKEIVLSGEIDIQVEVSRIGSDSCGNQYGAVEEVDVYLNIPE